ncbi:uncharacterized protein LOC111699728 [Eurytemora carolleeae]|uniref:uncharacterized protein LOC111699728 n=1 Tax=Eurytemora carolleeae TaxID=1294199 RepID=UPI000C78008F|nr:uncharacterized protein LOC111699728 [Eurytemora carolleeae]|eukprot:XP_023326228.1 uncharacterized protein LOC111699728 [Eurytemora affinis]
MSGLDHCYPTLPIPIVRKHSGSPHNIDSSSPCQSNIFNYETLDHLDTGCTPETLNVSVGSTDTNSGHLDISGGFSLSSSLNSRNSFLFEDFSEEHHDEISFPPFQDTRALIVREVYQVEKSYVESLQFLLFVSKIKDF